MVSFDNISLVKPVDVGCVLPPLDGERISLRHRFTRAPTANSRHSWRPVHCCSRRLAMSVAPDFSRPQPCSSSSCPLAPRRARSTFQRLGSTSCRPQVLLSALLYSAHVAMKNVASVQVPGEIPP